MHSFSGVINTLWKKKKKLVADNAPKQMFSFIMSRDDK